MCRNAVKYNAMEWNDMECNAMQWNGMECTSWHDAVTWNRMERSVTQCNDPVEDNDMMDIYTY